MANYQLEQTGAEVQALLNAVESPDTTPAAGSSNLITSGAVQAAVAGVSAEVTALGHEVDDLQAGNFVVPGGTETLVIPTANKVTGLYAPAAGTTFGASSYYNAYYLQAARDMEVAYTITHSLTNWILVVSDNIPVNGGTYVGISKGGSYDQGTFTIQAGQYICAISQYGTDLPQLSTMLYDSVNLVALVESLFNTRKATLAPTYFNGVRLVDTMTNQLWGKSTNTKIGNFTPVSATASTITLSSADAACIVNLVILSCKMQDGKYYNAYFSAASGNVITKVYDFGEDIDCQDIVEMQCLHDTINGANGIHLSPFGYRAMAHTIIDKLNTKHPFSDVFVGGWSAQFCLGAASYTDASIRDANGDVICSPELSGISVGGAVNRCEMVYAANIGADGPAYRTFYQIVQAAPNGASVSFRLIAKYPFKGFLRVNCARQPGNAGTVSLTIKDFSGNTIATQSVAYYADSYIFDLSGKYFDGVDVIVTMPDNSTTKIMITEMTLHETYIEDVQLRPIDGKSVVALLGSSNTQFPHLEDAETLCPGDPDNEIVERPDGTFGDGCGYLGKELARASGAVVDNWGKSGEQTPYGLDIIQKIFATKRYTHIVLSLFANDINAPRPLSEIISNIRQMAEYAKGQGAVPIVIMGYATNSGGGVIRYALMYDDLSQGMDCPFIYTSAELH